MLSSQVSPMRSLSESDCRETKQTLSVTELRQQMNLYQVVCFSYLVRVGHIRTAVTHISHPVVVSVSLVWVGNSRAVVEDILQACEHKHLSTFIPASCVKASTGKSEKHDRTQTHRLSNASPDGSVCIRRRWNSFQWPSMPGGGLPWKNAFLERRQTWPSA